MISSSYATLFTSSMLMTHKSLAPVLTWLLSLWTCVDNSYCAFEGPADIWLWRLKNEFIVSPPVCLFSRFRFSGDPLVSSLTLHTLPLFPHPSNLHQSILPPKPSQIYLLFFISFSSYLHLSCELCNSVSVGLLATSLDLCSAHGESACSVAISISLWYSQKIRNYIP